VKREGKLCLIDNRITSQVLKTARVEKVGTGDTQGEKKHNAKLEGVRGSDKRGQKVRGVKAGEKSR